MKARTKWIIAIGGLVWLSLFLLSLNVAQRLLAQDEGEEIPVGSVGLVPQSAVEQALETAVANGTLTQSEAAQILADIETHTTTAYITPPGWGEFEIPLVEAFPPDLSLAPGGLFSALQKAVEQEVITQADMEQILQDFAELAGEGVTIEMPEGNDDEEFNFRFSVEGSIEGLQTAMEGALDKAVENGRLTREQADQILADAQENNFFSVMPSHNPFVIPAPDAVEVVPFGWRSFGEGDLCLLEATTAQIELAVAQGKITQEEADSLLQNLEGVFEK